MKINNLLSLCFISLFIISASSCKKDTPKKAVTATDISNTEWGGTVSGTFLGFKITTTTIVKFTSANAGSYYYYDGATTPEQFNFTYTYSNWSGVATKANKSTANFAYSSSTKKITFDGDELSQSK